MESIICKGFDSDSSELLTNNDEEKKLTIRLSGSDYDLLKKKSKENNKSMNTLIVDAVKNNYSDFVYEFIHNNDVAKGVDKYIFNLLKVKNILPYMVHPLFSNNEMFLYLGINNYEDLEISFFENVRLIIFRANMVKFKHELSPGYTNSIPTGISSFYLIFVLIAKIEDKDKCIEMKNKIFPMDKDVIKDINLLRNKLNLELI